MWQFQYKHGDRPLDGYTIQRAAGRGGFGEVYYAVSDSGREVALKAVTGYEQIELRGISQCMNLKNPHLVSIFDVKYNDLGRPFVLMEFVAGPSLRQLLDESPGGLGTQKSAFFLREIAKGLTYLHECGIVHRDLKPGNIFYENGYVKIGDYGLSKAIAPTQHSGQTITVGTVHYMAPEIGGGRYDKSIDIYAMGAVLYEMLTGQPPFLGSSAGEILLKHVSAEPDVTHVEEPFRTVVRKAMAKDPADRYQSIQQMVEAVFGAEHVQQSVSCFSPDSLSMIAQRVGQRIAVGGGSATPPPIPRQRGTAAAVADDCAPACGTGERLAWMFDRVGDRLGAFGNRVADLGVHALPSSARRGDAAGAGDPTPEYGDPLCDPLSRRQRRLLGLMMLCVVSTAAGFLSPLGRSDADGTVPAMIGTFLAAAGAASGLLLAGRRILPQMNGDSGALRKLASGGTAAALMLIFSFVFFASAPGRAQDTLAGTALAAIVALLLIKPPDLSPSRPERVMFGSAVGAAAIGFGLSFPFDGSAGLAIGILGGAYLLAQVLSPWDAFAAKRREEMEDWDEEEDGPRPAPSPVAAREAAARASAGSPAGAPQPSWSAAWNAAAAGTGEAPTMAWPHGQAGAPAAGVPLTQQRPRRPVPQWVRYVWLFTSLIAVSIGIMMTAFAGLENLRGERFALTVGWGAGLQLLGVLCFVKMFQRTYRGWWSYAGKWLAAWACCQSILLAGLMLGEGERETIGALFFIVFPGLLLPVLLFLRFSPATAPATAAGEDAVPLPPPSPAPEARGEAPRGRERAASEETAARQKQAGEFRRRREPGQPLIVRLFGFVRDMAVGAVVTWLLLVALVAGVTMALDVPGMLAAGVPDPSVPRDITRGLGFEGWPHLFRIAGYGAGLAALLLASVVLIVSRRRTYGLHMVRAMAGVAVFGLSLALLGGALARGEWRRVPARGAIEAHAFGPYGEADPALIGPDRLVIHNGHGDAHFRNSFPASLERFLRDARPAQIIAAGCVGLMAVIMICWPARRRGESQSPRVVTVQQDFGTPLRADGTQPQARGAATLDTTK